MAEIDYIPVTIAQGTALSPQIDIGTKSLAAVSVPASWVTTSLSFQASFDGGNTWGELVDQTKAPVTVASITGAAQIAVDPNKLRGVQSLKVRSGTAASPINQTAAGGVTLTLITRLKRG